MVATTLAVISSTKPTPHSIGYWSLTRVSRSNGSWKFFACRDTIIWMACLTASVKRAYPKNKIAAPRRRPNSRLPVHALHQVQHQIGPQQHDHPEHHAAGLYGTGHRAFRSVVAEDAGDDAVYGAQAKPAQGLVERPEDTDEGAGRARQQAIRT